LVSLQLQHGPFAQTNDRNPGIDLNELLDSLFTGLAAMPFRILVEVMRIDLKRNESEAVKPFWVDDRHIVGGPQSGTGYVGTGTPTNKGDTGHDTLTDQREESQIIHLAHQFPGVSPANDDGISRQDGRCRIGRFVNTYQGVIQGMEALLYLFLVGIEGESNRGKGHKQDFKRFTSKEFGNLRHRIAQIGFSRHGGVTDQQESHSKKII